MRPAGCPSPPPSGPRSREHFHCHPGLGVCSLSDLQGSPSHPFPSTAWFLGIEVPAPRVRDPSKWVCEGQRSVCASMYVCMRWPWAARAGLWVSADAPPPRREPARLAAGLASLRAAGSQHPLLADGAGVGDLCPRDKLRPRCRWGWVGVQVSFSFTTLLFYKAINPFCSWQRDAPCWRVS